MKRIAPVIMCLVLLCGCADTGEKEFIRFVEHTAHAEEVSFTADVRAEYDDKTARFKLRYEHDGDGSAVTVLEPDILAGIKARLTGERLSLEYEGAMLDIGTLPDARLSPMSALPLMMKAIRNGHAEITWVEDERIAARIVPEDDYSVTLWLGSSLVPESAEISYKERSVVFIEISDWSAE